MSKPRYQSKPPAKPAEKRPRIACLRGPVSYSDSGVDVDAANGIIRNVAVITAGAAKGHPFDLDQKSIDMMVALAAQQPNGVKSRFKHPKIDTKSDGIGGVIQSVEDDTGSMVGRLKNVRLVGSQARGDIYLGSYAECIPGLGDVRKYLIQHALDDPTGIGLSCFFEYEVELVTDSMGNVLSRPARPLTFDACDFVGEPAANPLGLLTVKRAAAFDPRPPSGTPNSGWIDPNPKDPARAPIPASTPEWPVDAGAYLGKMVKDGPQTLGGIASQFSGRLEAMRAACSWLCSNGYAELIPGAIHSWRATPKGMSKAAMSWKK